MKRRLSQLHRVIPWEALVLSLKRGFTSESQKENQQQTMNRLLDVKTSDKRFTLPCTDILMNQYRSNTESTTTICYRIVIESLGFYEDLIVKSSQIMYVSCIMYKYGLVYTYLNSKTAIKSLVCF